MANVDETGPVEIDWNGHDVPSELAHLPPGRYRVEPVGEWDLPPEEEAGLEEAAAALERGEGIPSEQVADEMRQLLAARSASGGCTTTPGARFTER
ncbi:MAG: hypothetical protein JST54_11800 [Deltaproteobacteria bacterium]|nr:hypothetical protein [Deltaproteobacteria bacterium]